MPPALHFSVLAASAPHVWHRSYSRSGRAHPHLLRPCAGPGGDRTDNPDLIERTVDFLFKGARADKEPFGCALHVHHSQQNGAIRVSCSEIYCLFCIWCINQLLLVRLKHNT